MERNATIMERVGEGGKVLEGEERKNRLIYNERNYALGGKKTEKSNSTRYVSLSSRKR